MAQRRGSALLVAPVLALSLFLVGCPKRPATTAASAPPPTGRAAARARALRPAAPEPPRRARTAAAARAPPRPRRPRRPRLAGPSEFAAERRT